MSYRVSSLAVVLLFAVVKLSSVLVPATQSVPAVTNDSYVLILPCDTGIAHPRLFVLVAGVLCIPMLLVTLIQGLRNRAMPGWWILPTLICFAIEVVAIVELKSGANCFPMREWILMGVLSASVFWMCGHQLLKRSPPPSQLPVLR